MSAIHPPVQNGLTDSSDLPPYHPDAGWHWHDAALVVFERQDAGRSEFAVGAVDLYANANSGDLGGSYLELGAFSDLDHAVELYGRMQSAVDEQMLLPFQLADYLEKRFQDNAHKPEWRTAGPDEYAAYEAVRSLEALEMPIEADYRFTGGISEDGEPALQAVKRWTENGESREARQTLDTFGMSEEAAVVARELNALAETEGVQAAMDLAQHIAVSSGHIEAGQETRVFREGPPDPTTVEPESDPVQRFQEAFADILTRPLQPVDPDVNYSFDLVDADPWTKELRAHKWWLGEDGALRQDALTMKSYSLDSYDYERENEREIAALDREGLEFTHLEEGLEASMRKAEALAVFNGELDPDREDGRLFHSGPADRFTTLRETELAGREHEATVPDRDEWQELLDRAENDQPEPERHYWQMHHRPVETPDGAPLGTALVMIEFPQLTPDFGAYLDQNGMDDSIYPTEARRLEVAHFADEASSRKFEAEFRSYLVPGILDGPDLAPAVAKLEGLPGVWEEMGFHDIVAHMSGAHVIVQDAPAWHMHKPEAEREFEGFESVDLEL